MLSGLLLLGVYVLWDTGYVLEVRAPSWVERVAGLMPFSIPFSIPLQPVLAVSLGLTAYWTLQALGRDRIAFWLMALAATLPHSMAVWSHNRIGWYELLGLQAELAGDRSIYWDTTLFVACLVGLVALHRTVGMKRLQRWMLLRGVERLDRHRVILYESTMLVGLVVAGLLLAGLMVFVAAVLSRYDELLEGAPLAIVTIGGGAAILLALSLLLWFRGWQDAHDEEGAKRASSST